MQDGRGRLHHPRQAEVASRAPALPARGEGRAPPRQPPRPPPMRRRPAAAAAAEEGDDAIHATVSLPPVSSSSRGVRRPGMAVRTGALQPPSSLPSAAAAAAGAGLTPPVPPPRPECTISPWTRDLVNPSPPPPDPSGRLRGEDNSAAVTVESASASVSPVSLLSPSATTATAASPSPPDISLTSPRPGNDRSQNLYVDAPLKSRRSQRSIQLPQSTKIRSTPSSTNNSNSSSSSSSNNNSSNSSRVESGKQQERLLSPSRLAGRISPSSSLSSSVIKSPPSPRFGHGDSSSLFLKNEVADFKHDLSDFHSLSSVDSGVGGEPSDSRLPSSSSQQNAAADSIICRDCGRCKCAACRAPRRLPERWVCGDSCRLSAGTLVDALSCMWVVRAAMYHFGKDVEESDDSKNAFDEPCSCSADHACARFTCLAGASLLLPCLCCYAPLRCCVRGAERAYEAATSNGCRCDREAASGGGSSPSTTRTSQPLSQHHFSSISSSLASTPAKKTIGHEEVCSASTTAASSPAASPARGKVDSAEKRLLG